MPSEIVWALVGSGGLVVVAGVAVRARRCRQAIGRLLLRLIRWWLYEWWD